MISHQSVGRHLIPSSCLKAKGVDMESESGYTANDVKGEIKEHVFGKVLVL